VSLIARDPRKQGIHIAADSKDRAERGDRDKKGDHRVLDRGCATPIEHRSLER